MQVASRRLRPGPRERGRLRRTAVEKRARGSPMLSTFLVTLNEWIDWIAIEYGAVVIAFGALLYLMAHLLKFKQDWAITFSWLMILGTTAIFAILAVTPQAMSLARMISLLLMYGVALFVLLSTYMLRGWAKRLTKRRGERWLKELDYIYLTLALAGIIASVNRLPFVIKRIDASDVLAPLLLATAVVIRFIKTRAEIEGWNKKGV
jgi:hypothetical protein